MSELSSEAKPSEPSASARWITTAAELPALAEALQQARWVALDTEANSLFVYREYCCLIQLNLEGALWLVDVQALLREANWPGLDPMTAVVPPSSVLDALKPGLARSDRRLWIHGGEYDCGVLRRDFGIVLGGLWDTQQAGQFLGFEKTNYGALVERFTGIMLAKDHAQYDWRTRPIDPIALEYAIDDVRHLPTIAEALVTAIAAADVVEEHAIACIAVADTGISKETVDGGSAFDPLGFWRIKGVREVPKERLAVLSALYRWRDGLARTVDRPPGRLLNNEALLALARQAPTNFQLLKKSGLRGRLLAESGDAVIAVVREALTDTTAPQRPPRDREVDEAEQLRETRLKDWRRTEADKRKVPLQVVLPAKALDHLKRHGVGGLDDAPQFGSKRMQRYGERLRQICQGM